MKPIFAALALAFLLTSALHAQTKLEFQTADTVRAVVERQVGQVVELRLKSGDKIGGKVAQVGERMVHLTDLTGADFFQAVVSLDEITAVVLRTKAR